jgi:23S rRNA (uracil1939-C5)-methyltransferase
MSKTNLDYQVYQEPILLTVDTLNEDGQGISYFEGYEIFMDNAIDGEEVLVEIGAPFVKGSKRRPGRILEYRKISEDRNNKNSLLHIHGIYPYEHLTYLGTLKRKQQAILQALKKAKIKTDDIRPIVGCDIAKPSRFKTIRHFALSENRIINGFYAIKSHSVIAVTDSFLEPPWFNNFANALCLELTKVGADIYDEKTGKGLLRALQLRDSIKERMSILITSAPPKEQVKKIYLDTASQYKIDCVFVNINKGTGNRVLGKEFINLTKKNCITLPLGGLYYEVGPNSFLQVNYGVAQQLYSRVCEFLGTDLHAHALDLCCGVGTISLYLASHFAKVTGIEIVDEAIKYARNNASLNGITNTIFIAGDIHELLERELQDQKLSAIVCDPSRVGIGEKECLSLCKIKRPLKLAYIFCSLKALSRDLEVLYTHGFKIESVEGFDMFPYSSHVETLVLLSKNQD